MIIQPESPIPILLGFLGLHQCPSTIEWITINIGYGLFLTRRKGVVMMATCEKKSLSSKIAVREL